MDYRTVWRRIEGCFRGVSTLKLPMHSSIAIESDYYGIIFDFYSMTLCKISTWKGCLDEH